MYSSVFALYIKSMRDEKREKIISDVCNLLANQVTAPIILQYKKVGGVIQGEITPTSPDDIAKQILVS